ncbi:MAG: aspartate kinase [Ruminococcaceae bacterium]|nr:aspartate kinase [Oscillospiraceae bacterium]
MDSKVVKFGGSSLADAEQFKKVAAIVKADSKRKYVVASAPGKRFDDDIKVTDLLYKCFELAIAKKNIDETFSKIKDRYNGIISDLGLDFSLEDELETIKAGIIHRASRDYVASRGEYLNAMVLAAYLGYDFIDAETCIFFDDDGNLDTEKTNRVLSELLMRHSRAVIPGFYGCMSNGTIKTFSRGGSDITGSIVARAIEAEIYENWTDVSGMLMADPRIVDNPKVIDVITYGELRELSYMGASVMHEDAIFPVKVSNIPINIRNTNSPEDPGTMIVPEASGGSPYIVTGVAGRKGFSIINIEKDMMNAEIGFGRRVLEVLENHKVCFEHLPSSIDTMSVVISTSELRSTKYEMVAEIAKVVNADRVTVEDGIALIAVVGRSMVSAKGTAVRIFSAIARENINIKMIDQGSSERNIIVGIEESDYKAAIRAIYSEFVK